MKIVSKILLTLGVLAGSFVLIGSFSFEQENTLDAPPAIFTVVLAMGTIAAIIMIWRKKADTPEEEKNLDIHK